MTCSRFDAESDGQRGCMSYNDVHFCTATCEIRDSVQLIKRPTAGPTATVNAFDRLNGGLLPGQR